MALIQPPTVSGRFHRRVFIRLHLFFLCYSRDTVMPLIAKKRPFPGLVKFLSRPGVPICKHTEFFSSLGPCSQYFPSPASRRLNNPQLLRRASPVSRTTATGSIVVVTASTKLPFNARSALLRASGIRVGRGSSGSLGRSWLPRRICHSPSERPRLDAPRSEQSLAAQRRLEWRKLG